MLQELPCPECGCRAQAPEDDADWKCLHCGAVFRLREDGAVVDGRQAGAYFPLQYFVDFLQYIAARPDKYEIITYDELCWPDDIKSQNVYRNEFDDWKRRIRSSNEKNGKIYILLQHDVDSRPERTMAMLRHEEAIGTRSNSMIFSRRIDRKRLKHHGVLEETEYPVDHRYLSYLEQDHRFVVGYHCNVPTAE